MSERVPCSRPGCLLPGTPCYLGHEDREVADWLCPDHAVEAGYCASCGVWCVGDLGFDLAPHLCESCLDALTEEDPGW